MVAIGWLQLAKSVNLACGLITVSAHFQVSIAVLQLKQPYHSSVLHTCIVSDTCHSPQVTNQNAGIKQQKVGMANHGAVCTITSSSMCYCVSCCNPRLQ